MKIRLNEDYYYWSYDWCDTENRVLWAKVNEGCFCGACHKKQFIGGETPAVLREHIIAAGL